MDNQEIINKTVEFVKVTLADAEGWHDRRHIYRVWKTAKHIAETEKGDLLIIELWALLHDIADAKFYNGDSTIGPKKAKEFLESMNLNQNIVNHVESIVKNVSFGGGNHQQDFSSIELNIVQDADRLDALWAIGIARTFHYNGHKNREIYNPNIKPNLHMTKNEYYKSEAPAINHFYEKLLLLKDRMNTQTGKKLAEHRHEFTEKFLEEFYQEREGKV